MDLFLEDGLIRGILPTVVDFLWISRSSDTYRKKIINAAAAGKFTQTEELVRDMRYERPKRHIKNNTIRFFASSIKSRTVCLAVLMSDNGDANRLT